MKKMQKKNNLIAMNKMLRIQELTMMMLSLIMKRLALYYPHFLLISKTRILLSYLHALLCLTIADGRL